MNVKQKLFKNVKNYVFMKYCHNISVSVFIKPEDIIEDDVVEHKILDTLHLLMFIDWEKEKIHTNSVQAEGFEGRKIKILELRLVKEHHTRIFIDALLKKLSSEQKSFLKSDKERRLDENDNFFIRLDRKKLLQGIYEITSSGDCFHIRMNIAAFPKKRENALRVIDEIFSG